MEFWGHMTYFSGPVRCENTYQCNTCKSQKKDRDGEQTWHCSGHPLSFGYEAHPKRV